MSVLLPDHILYQDNSLMVINKPARLPVHGGPSGVSSVEDQLDVLQGDFTKAPQLVHRLDADTAGCLVLARHFKTAKRLFKLFEEGVVKKTYWAIVHGIPEEKEGIIDLALKKISSKEKGWRMIVAKSGKPSKTRYKVIGQAGTYSLVECQLLTGRTHQLRVHLAAIGCPIVGDPMYGDHREKGTYPMQLLARHIRFPFGSEGKMIDVTAPVPSHMEKLMGLLLPDHKD